MVLAGGRHGPLEDCFLDRINGIIRIGGQGLFEGAGLPGVPEKRALKRPEGRAPPKGGSCDLRSGEANRMVFKAMMKSLRRTVIA